MEKRISNKIVIFGAEKIRRSFIGQLFSTVGFEVVFIDVFDRVINELNQQGKYRVILKSELKETIIVKNVRGVNARDKKLVSRKINNSTVMSVSVGFKALSDISPLIAGGLKERYKKN